MISPRKLQTGILGEKKIQKRKLIFKIKITEHFGRPGSALQAVILRSLSLKR